MCSHRLHTGVCVNLVLLTYSSVLQWYLNQKRKTSNQQAEHSNCWGQPPQRISNPSYSLMTGNNNVINSSWVADLKADQPGTKEVLAGQCHRWTFSSPICSVGSVICIENKYLDNWPKSIRDLIPDGLELPLSRSSWSRSQLSNI